MKRFVQLQKLVASAEKSIQLYLLTNSLVFQMEFDKMVWCNLRNIPCIHPEPDGLENCRYCEKYSFTKNLEYQIKKKNKKSKSATEPD